MLALEILNVAFFIFHTLLILFNVFGWAWKKQRPWNLVTLSLTAFSWGVMGLWKGVGYCICTDWHWQVRAAMGIHETSSSYLALLTRILIGWNPPVALVNPVALLVFIFSLAMSLILNIRDRISRNSTRSPASVS